MRRSRALTLAHDPAATDWDRLMRETGSGFGAAWSEPVVGLVERYVDRTSVVPGAHALLAGLRGAGWTCVGASAGCRRFQLPALRHLELLDAFDRVLFADDVPSVKRRRAFYGRSRRKSRTSPASATATSTTASTHALRLRRDLVHGRAHIVADRLRHCAARARRPVGRRGGRACARRADRPVISCARPLAVRMCGSDRALARRRPIAASATRPRSLRAGGRLGGGRSATEMAGRPSQRAPVGAGGRRRAARVARGIAERASLRPVPRTAAARARRCPGREPVNPCGHYRFDTRRGTAKGRLRPLRTATYIPRQTSATNATATNP
jgi:hypothetical protein